MSTVQEIRSAIEKLGLEQRAQLIAELCGWEDDDWDRQMKKDVAEGKFESRDRATSEAVKSGTTIPFDRILGEQ